MGTTIAKLKARAKAIKRDAYALSLAYRHPDTPWYAKLLAVLVVAYALSPIDLIPDFIPVLGMLDDLLIVPAGIALAVRLIPEGVMDECRELADEGLAKKKPVSAVIASVLVLALYALLAYLTIRALFFS